MLQSAFVRTAKDLNQGKILNEQWNISHQGAKRRLSETVQQCALFERLLNAIYGAKLLHSPGGPLRISKKAGLVGKAEERSVVKETAS